VKIFAKTVVAAAGVLATLAWSGPARSGEAEVALLSSYIGQWQGQGALVGGEADEPFRCRLTVAKGNQAKINYTGRCSLVDANLSISGTIAYVDAAGQYEAAMSSNAGFTGVAIGRPQGGGISFDLRERQQDRAGSNVRIGARITLVNDNITVDFEVEFNDSGEVLTASVPFDR
jgi:hypothetical protein